MAWSEDRHRQVWLAPFNLDLSAIPALYKKVV